MLHLFQRSQRLATTCRDETESELLLLSTDHEDAVTDEQMLVLHRAPAAQDPDDD